MNQIWFHGIKEETFLLIKLELQFKVWAFLEHFFDHIFKRYIFEYFVLFVSLSYLWFDFFALWNFMFWNCVEICWQSADIFKSKILDHPGKKVFSKDYPKPFSLKSALCFSTYLISRLISSNKCNNNCFIWPQSKRLIIKSLANLRTFKLTRIESNKSFTILGVNN